MTIKEFNEQPLRPARLLATVRYYSLKNQRGRVFERVPIVPSYLGSKEKLRPRIFRVCTEDPSTVPLYHYPHTLRIILNVDFLEEDANEKTN